MLEITDAKTETFSLDYVTYNIPVRIMTGKWAGLLAVYCGTDYIIVFEGGKQGFRFSHYKEAVEWKYAKAPGVTIQFTSD